MWWSSVKDTFGNCSRVTSPTTTVAIGRFAVADQVPLGAQFRKGFHHLLPSPFGIFRQQSNPSLGHQIADVVAVFLVTLPFAGVYFILCPRKG
jgi:hypothetical protein